MPMVEAKKTVSKIVICTLLGHVLVAGLSCAPEAGKGTSGPKQSNPGSSENITKKGVSADSEYALPGAALSGESWDLAAVSVIIIGARQLDDGRLQVSTCNGTLLDDRTVLTAAHCIKKTNTDFYVTGSDSLNISQTGTWQKAALKAEKVIAHPEFTKAANGSFRNDFGLMTLANPIEGYGAWKKPARIGGNVEPTAGLDVRLVGFSRKADNPNNGKLRIAQTKIGVLKDGLLTLSQSVGVGGCEGDSGGPIFARASSGDVVLLGLTAMGENSCLSPLPAYHDLRTSQSFLASHHGGVPSPPTPGTTEPSSPVTHPGPPPACKDLTGQSALLDESVFNWNTYFQMNPDLKTAGLSSPDQAAQHWLSFGINEGRQAHANFHAPKYVTSHADLQAAYGSNLAQAIEHYVRLGICEGRKGL